MPLSKANLRANKDNDTLFATHSEKNDFPSCLFPESRKSNTSVPISTIVMLIMIFVFTSNVVNYYERYASDHSVRNKLK